MLKPKSAVRENSFFSWKKLHKKYPQYAKLKLQCVVAPRNCGKSYATYKEKIDIPKLLKPDSKVLFMRNTENELKRMRSDFNSRYKGKYKAKGDFIYEIIREPAINKKTGEEFFIERQGELVGYFGAISTYTNYKSLEAGDIKFVFYEEFNEDTTYGQNIYFKFINLLKTFERFNDVQLVMLGNKDSYKTDFHINWDIMPEDKPDEDVISEIRTANGKLIGVWYDLSASNFAGLGNADSLADGLASLDSRTSSYAQGGYRDPLSELVLNYKKIIPSFVPKMNLSIDDQTYVLGQLANTDGYWAILSPWNYKDKTLTNYALDVSSRLIKNAKILEEDDNFDLGNFVFKLLKNQRVVFDSYDTYEAFRLNRFLMRMIDISGK